MSMEEWRETPGEDLMSIEGEEPEQFFSGKSDEDGINWNESMDSIGSSTAQDLVANAMNNLSLEERRGALHDIHGVADIAEEAPEFVAAKLHEMNVVLNKVKSKQGYDKAAQQSPSYVQDRDFRIMFLRAENFSARRAANRVICHFDAKLQLFGEIGMGRDIRLSDLNEEDMIPLRSGHFQWLPQRDRAGRAVLFWTPVSFPCTAQSRFRAAFWGVMNALRDIETQKRGVVGITAAIGPRMGSFDKPAVLKVPWFHRALPLRIVGFHSCSDKVNNRPFFRNVLRMVSAYNRVRFRCHQGDHKTCVYSLMTFGIPSGVLPMSPEGTVVTDFHIERLDKCQQQENLSTVEKRDLIFIPGPFDVLLGRSKHSQENLGNLRYRSIIETFQDRYETAKKFEKRSIADQVIQAVKNCSGRFLQEHYADFAEVPDVKVREKVAHSFRSLRYTQQARTQKKTESTQHSLSLSDMVRPDHPVSHLSSKRARAC